MFDYEGQIYSCFGFQNKIVLYKAASHLQTITLDPSLDPQDVSIVLQEVVYDTQSQTLLFVARHDTHLKSY